MINTQHSSNTQLKLLVPNTNRALQEVLKSATQEQLQGLTGGSKTLGDILHSLFSDTLQNNTQEKNLLDLLKNNPTLKNLTNTQTTLKALIKELPTNTQLSTTLKQFTHNIHTINGKDLHTKLQNSGVFLENKLKNDTALQNDLKAVLLTAHKEISDTSSMPNKVEILKHIDKLLLQIDYFQLSSSLSNAPTLFIPYSWEQLKEGSITIRKKKKNHHICDIELTLEEYGEIMLRLGLFENTQLYITITTHSTTLKEMILTHIDLLKTQLKTVGLTPKDISFTTPNTQHSYTTAQKNISCGFEVNV